MIETDNALSWLATVENLLFVATLQGGRREEAGNADPDIIWDGPEVQAHPNII